VTLCSVLLHTSKPTSVNAKTSQYTLGPHKNKTREFLAQFQLTDKILKKNLEDIFLSILRTQLQLHFQRSLCNECPCLKQSILRTQLQLHFQRMPLSQTEIVSQLQQAVPFDCCCSHQSLASTSLCCVRAQDEYLSTFCDKFMLQCVRLMLSKFLHLTSQPSSANKYISEYVAQHSIKSFTNIKIILGLIHSNSTTTACLTYFCILLITSGE